MSTKLTHHKLPSLLLLALLTACGTVTPPSTPTADATNIFSKTAATATEITASELKSAPSPTTPPTSALEPSPTQLPLVTVDGLRMAYVIDGNLYVQESGQQPIQLTNEGLDHHPIFSDDGQKIVFLRGAVSDLYKAYSINVDGSQEQPLVTSDALAALQIGYANSLEVLEMEFVPGTHQLLFNTQEFKPSGDWTYDMNRIGAKPNLDILLANTDTSQIKRLLAPGKGGPFQISPNGKLVAIQTSTHLDVINLDGKIIHANLDTYPSTWPYIQTPEIYWTQTSDKLNIAFPIPTSSVLDQTGPAPRTIKQYTLGSFVREFSFSPHPMGYDYAISPDGNWVVYTFADYAGKTNETATPGIYIGNLNDGTAQPINVSGLNIFPISYSWSPDNTHFVFEDAQNQTYLGNIHGEVIPLNSSYFTDWIDASRYLFGNVNLGEIGKETQGKVAHAVGINNSHPFTFVFLKDK